MPTKQYVASKEMDVPASAGSTKQYVVAEGDGAVVPVLLQPPKQYVVAKETEVPGSTASANQAVHSRHGDGRSRPCWLSQASSTQSPRGERLYPASSREGN